MNQESQKRQEIQYPYVHPLWMYTTDDFARSLYHRGRSAPSAVFVKPKSQINIIAWNAA